MKGMKQRFKKRRRILISVFSVTIIATIWYAYLMWNLKTMNWLEFSEEIVGMALSALISTFLAIWLTRNDILENDFSQKKEKFGVIAFEDGYKNFLRSEDGEHYLHVHNWEEFFTKGNRDKEIDIVGVALRGFFDDENSSLPQKLLMLCVTDGYKVNIILGNPYSEEVKIQAIGQRKESEEHIVNSIKTTYDYFESAIAELDKQYLNGLLSCAKKPSEILDGRFNIVFSSSMPKALILRSGSYMLVTPYQMQPEGPSVAPTLVVKDSDSVAFYDQYKKYIDRLKEMSSSFENLQLHISAKTFFDQSYGDNISQEFKNDLRTCSSVDILGLGQNKMFTIFEHDLIKVVQRGAKIRAVMADPDGSSTEMCVARSLIHEKLEDAVREHKSAINTLILIRDKYAANVEDVKVYTWNCFFPYTMYAFNLNEPSKAKMYIWITNLFAYSNERDGFIIDGKFDPDHIKKYKAQYEQVMQAAIMENSEITDRLNI